jgi:argininosuccinate lyase
MKRTHDLQAILINLAERYRDTIMPSYTHMQQAQPGTFCHYLLSFVDRLQDDLDRCREVLARVNRSPLGTAASPARGGPSTAKDSRSSWFRGPRLHCKARPGRTVCRGDC